jgi:hypothetical protein
MTKHTLNKTTNDDINDGSPLGETIWRGRRCGGSVNLEGIIYKLQQRQWRLAATVEIQ